MSWTSLLALAAHTTLGRVDVSHIVVYGDCVKSALLGTLAASYAR